MGPEDLISRRNFLARALKAGLTGTLVAGGGILFYDPDGPMTPVVQAVSLPDFTISGIKKKLCIVHGPDRKKNLRFAFQALGGMESFIRPKDRVLIKVNAAFATPPQLGATTHPELVSETVRMCIESGAAYVAVTDNPINDPQSCFELTGIGPAARQAGARVILPDPGAFAPLTVPGARLIRNWPVMVGPFEGITRVIGMAPVKDHHRSGASMTLKKLVRPARRQAKHLSSGHSYHHSGAFHHDPSEPGDSGRRCGHGPERAYRRVFFGPEADRHPDRRHGSGSCGCRRRKPVAKIFRPVAFS